MDKNKIRLMVISDLRKTMRNEIINRTKKKPEENDTEKKNSSVKPLILRLMKLGEN